MVIIYKVEPFNEKELSGRQIEFAKTSTSDNRYCQWYKWHYGGQTYIVLKNEKSIVCVSPSGKLTTIASEKPIYVWFQCYCICVCHDGQIDVCYLNFDIIETHRFDYFIDRAEILEGCLSVTTLEGLFYLRIIKVDANTKLVVQERPPRTWEGKELQKHNETQIMCLNFE